MSKIFAVVLVFSLFVSFTLAQLQYNCSTAPSTPGDRRTNKCSLKVAHFNAEWLFLNGSSCPGSGCAWDTYQQAYQHLEDVASIIKNVNPDIINLVEVSDCTVLNTLNGLLTGMNYNYYLIKGTDTATGQNVGLLTRVDPAIDLQRTTSRAKYPVSGSTCGSSNSGDSSVSKHLYTQFKVNSLTINFVGAHLLAFPTDPSRCSQREAQAMVLSNYTTANSAAGTEIIVTGDFNDYAPDVLDANNDVPISRVLDMLGTIGSETLTNVASTVSSKDLRYSAWYDSNGNCSPDFPRDFSMIDHMLVSDGLLNRMDGPAEFDHSYSGDCTSLWSDHWPVVATFNTC